MCVLEKCWFSISWLSKKIQRQNIYYSARDLLAGLSTSFCQKTKNPLFFLQQVSMSFLYWTTCEAFVFKEFHQHKLVWTIQNGGMRKTANLILRKKASHFSLQPATICSGLEKLCSCCFLTKTESPSPCSRGEASRKARITFLSLFWDSITTA